MVMVVWELETSVWAGWGGGRRAVCQGLHLLQVVSYLDIETLYLPFMILKFNIFSKGVRIIGQNYTSWIFFPQNYQIPTMSIGSPVYGRHSPVLGSPPCHVVMTPGVFSCCLD